MFAGENNTASVACWLYGAGHVGDSGAVHRGAAVGHTLKSVRAQLLRSVC